MPRSCTRSWGHFPQSSLCQRSVDQVSGRMGTVGQMLLEVRPRRKSLGRDTTRGHAADGHRSEPQRVEDRAGVIDEQLAVNVELRAVITVDGEGEVRRRR